MRILDIRDGEIDVLYHAKEARMVPGTTLKITDEDGKGVIAQVISNRLMPYNGSSEQSIQESLEERLSSRTQFVRTF